MKNGVKGCPHSIILDERKLRNVIESDIAKTHKIELRSIDDRAILEYVDEIIVNRDESISIKYKSGKLSNHQFLEG